jgi:hypothetical protein
MGPCYLAWVVLILIFCGWFVGYVLVLFIITMMFFFVVTDFLVGVLFAASPV